MTIPSLFNTDSCCASITVFIVWDFDDGGSYVSKTTGSLNETDRALIGIVVDSFRDECTVVVTDLVSSPTPLKIDTSF